MSDRISHRSQRWAEQLPSWLGSIRFRLTALYSLFLFGLAALVVGGIYLAVAARLDDETVSRDVEVPTLQTLPDGRPVVDRERYRVEFRTFEQQVNERSLEVLRRYSFLALSLLFLASMVVGWVVAGRVLSPIDRITAVAREIQATDLSRRIDLQGPPDELKNLADTFDAMLSRLDGAFESQRRFIQETSHELRNPLAVIRTNLDVALGDPDASAGELRRAGEVVQRTAERMSHLVDDLLAYARHGSAIREEGRLEVGSLVTDAVEEFTNPASARSLQLESAPMPGLWVDGDRVALRQAIANLVGNAVRLAPAGSRIRVGAGQEDSWVWMAVEDEGPGIPPEQRDLVFQRFWKGAGTAGRNGLGLTIVRQIAESHRGHIRLVPSAQGGSTFVLWLPAAPAPT